MGFTGERQREGTAATILGSIITSVCFAAVDCDLKEINMFIVIQWNKMV